MARCLKPDEIESGLQRKGFRMEKGRKHITFTLYNQEGRKEVSTYLSHNSDVVAGDLMNFMRHQLGLEKDDFIRLIECPLTTAEYLHKRRERLRGVLRILKRG